MDVIPRTILLSECSLYVQFVCFYFRNMDASVLGLFSQAKECDLLTPIIIYWDFENVSIPKRVKADNLYLNMVQRIRDFGYYGAIDCRAFVGVKGPQLGKHRTTLTKLGVNFFDATSSLPNAADELLISHIASYIAGLGEETKRSVQFLFAGDNIYRRWVSDLRDHGCLVLLVYPNHATDSDLRDMFSESMRMSWRTFIGMEEKR